MTYVLDLAECTPERAAQVGGKAIGLGSLMSAKLPVPPGFAVTTDAYRRSVRAAGLEESIASLLATAADGDERTASAGIIALFDDAMLDAGVADDIDAAYEQLSGGNDLPVAVRSSATAEDLPDASFAGQQDTYLWILGSKAVRHHVVRCWASLFTPRAIGYRARHAIAVDDLAMGVVVQQMVPAEVAGVMMTLEPVGGDRSQIYVEAAYGLGEGVVRGDVGADRFWVSKSSLTLSKEEIESKDQAHRFDPERDEVRLVDVPLDLRLQPSLGEREIIALADLGRQIEQHFDAPMDIEWAIAGSGDQREISLLQARPETVWSQKVETESSTLQDDWDPLHSTSAPGSHWTTSNLGEAMPGVLTPLSWTMWAAAIERAPREAAYRIGAFTQEERQVAANINDRASRIFFGRPAIEVEFFAALGDRMPGTSGQETVRSLFGRVPDDMNFHPTRHRYPHIAWRFPLAFITTPRKMRAFAAEQDRWYQKQIASVDRLDLADAQRLLLVARDHLERALVMQVIGTLSVIQPIFNGLVELAASVDFDDVNALTAMGGGAELDLVSDIWAASRGRLELAEVQRRHGFHGPSEGELSSRIWRQNPAPLKRLIDEYAGRDDSADPRVRERRHAAGRGALEQRFLEALPRAKRPIGRLLLTLGRSRIPLRGMAKRSFLQAFDVGRAAACRIGELQHQRGVLKTPDDVFHLTVDELTSHLPEDPNTLIAARRTRREEYQRLVALSEWTGSPRRVTVAETTGEALGDDAITGIGVSSGIVEATVRVVTSPDDEDIMPDEILVAPFTDPSWSSLLFISAGLVVDIGGALSHAAVVAREMEIPCVVNTRNGTTSLHTGDRVRIDGTTGTVHVLQRAGELARPASAG